MSNTLSRLLELLHEAVVDGDLQGARGQADALQARMVAESAAAPAPSPGGLPADNTWRHNGLRISPPPTNVLTSVADTAALEAKLQAAVSRQQTFKAIGDGWALSRLPVGKDWVCPLAGALGGTVRFENAGATCIFPAGMDFEELATALSATGRALENVPGFSKLTFGGTTACGGQGSGLRYGPIDSQITALRILYVDNAGDTQLRRVSQGEPHFEALRTSIGALGIITEFEVQTVKEYFISETRRLVTWSEALDELPKLLHRQRLPIDDPDALHSVEVWINPYRVAGERQCIIGERAFSPGPAQGERPLAIRHGNRTFFGIASSLLDRFGAAVPMLLNAALDSTRSGPVVMPWHEGLGFGGANKAEVEASAVSFALSSVTALEHTMDRVFQALSEQSSKGHWVTSPLGLRFAKGGSATLAAAKAPENALLEIPILKGSTGAKAVLRAFIDAIPEGRPHWGQYNPLDPEGLRQRHGAAATDAFIAAMAHFDPLGIFATPRVLELKECWRTAPPVRASQGKQQRPDTHRDNSRYSYGRLYRDAKDAPAIVVRTVAELKAALDEAHRDGTALTMHGGGWALDRQAMRPKQSGKAQYLRLGEHSEFTTMHFDAATDRMTVGAMVRWHDFVHRSLAEHCLPPVVVTAANATIGGTLASNSISQAARYAGHEADTLTSVKVVLPRNGQAEVRTLTRPDPADTSEDAELYRAIIGGYGLVGVIVEATYQLERLGSGSSTEIPARDCECLWEHSPEEFMAVSSVTPHSSLGSALATLPVTDPSDKARRACVIFWDGAKWVPRVVETSFERRAPGQQPKPQQSYCGNTFLRKQIETFLSTMQSCSVAHTIAARETAKMAGQTYRDPVCGYLFAMYPNEKHKENLDALRNVLGGLVQCTFAIPDANAEAFLQDTFAILRHHGERLDEDTLSFIDKDLLPRPFGNVVRSLSSVIPAEISDLGGPLTNTFAGALGELPTLVPALFEMVWLPKDQHLLSATHGGSGFGISLTFQGPGVTSPGAFSHAMHDAIYGALRDLSAACEHRGGRVHLTKNLFVHGDTVAYTTRMLGPRRQRFLDIRNIADPQNILTSRFAKEALGF